jgi:acyl-CoA thioester hydrolase
MSTPIHEYRLTILEHHLDTFGHVNNATYLQILEEARWDWITAGGYGLARVAELGQGPTILQCTLKFRRELRNREAIVIRSWGESYLGKIAEIRQDLLTAAGELSCEATFTMGLFDVKARKLIEPSDAFLNCVGWERGDWKPK